MPDPDSGALFRLTSVATNIMNTPVKNVNKNINRRREAVKAAPHRKRSYKLIILRTICMSGSPLARALLMLPLVRLLLLPLLLLRRRLWLKFLGVRGNRRVDVGETPR